MKITIYTKEKIYNFKSIYDKDYNYALKHAHRKDGPAKIWYYNNGNIGYEAYYINDKYYSEDAFNQILLKRKLQLI